MYRASDPLRRLAGRRSLAVGLALVMASAPGAAQEQRSVLGTVQGRFERVVRLLPFSVVEAWGPGFRRSVVSDSLGRYRIDALPAGPLRLRATHAGHEPVVLEVLVPVRGSVTVDLELAAQPVELPPVDVTTDVQVPEPTAREPVQAGPAVGRVEAAALEIGAGFVDAGLADALRALGGNDPYDPADVLFMRGSTTDLKLVLLDGAPVYTPFHVAGLLRSFEPDVLGRADLHVGGAPARYDGGLTYILDLRTRSPRRDGPHASGSLDLLSASIAAESPLGGRAGVVGSARSLHGLGEAPLGASPYGYRDALVAAELEPAAGHLVRASGFWNREAVVLDLPSAQGAAGGPAAADEASWSNRAASLAYRGTRSALFWEATAAASGYRAALPLRPPDPEGAAPILAEASTERVRAGVEVGRALRSGVVRGGVALERLDAAYWAAPLDGSGGSARSDGTSTTVGGYVDASHQVGSALHLRVGVRADRFSGDGPPRIAPRAALAWSLGPQALLTVATGRYHQRARATEVAVERSLSELVGDSARGGQLLPVATADHVVVSLDQILGEDVRLGLAGFWKAYRGLHATQVDPVLSSGVDLRVQRRGERATAWLGYGLSWYWSGVDLSGQSSDFTGRQLLTAGLSGAVGSRLGADVRLAYGAGLPYTSVPFRSAEAADEAMAPTGEGALEQTPPLPGGLDEDFLRLDVEIHATLRPEWGGRAWQIRPYLRVLNALDRRDALFYAFQPWRSDEVMPLAERPLVPVLGVAWRF